MKWFSIAWWEYLLEKPLTLRKFWCRLHGHKEGPWFHNIGGAEPDWRCRNCGDYLG
jgi:hypothetical protein